MGQFKLTKQVRQNTYTATCEILLNHECIADFRINYGYTSEDKLRIKSYCVILDQPIALAAGIGIYNHFEVDGRWETKGSRGRSQTGSRSYCAEYDLFETEYKTAFAAKAAALAFITQTLEAAEASRDSRGRSRTF